ncbi:MAG: hypothetical protein QOJ18_27, partial [Microbacteriaceae bacterium]|nr:hypothetical protein [Microbacteriaceae bacterium]
PPLNQPANTLSSGYQLDPIRTSRYRYGSFAITAGHRQNLQPPPFTPCSRTRHLREL